MAIYQFNSDKVRVTTHETLLEAQEMTDIPAKRIISAVNSKSLCDGKWYFSRQPFIDVLFGSTETGRRKGKEGDVDKGEKVVKCNFGITHNLSDRVSKVIGEDEDRPMFFRKALLEYVEKLEAEKSPLQ